MSKSNKSALANSTNTNMSSLSNNNTSSVINNANVNNQSFLPRPSRIVSFVVDNQPTFSGMAGGSSGLSSLQ